MVQPAHPGPHPSRDPRAAAARNRTGNGARLRTLLASLAACRRRGSQLHGADGTLHIIRQLQGYEIPAVAWESEILARRIANYDPEFLDELCFSGEVMWARVSPHPAIAQNRRVRPTRIAPVTLFLARRCGLADARHGPADSSGLSHPARDVLRALERNGASFFVDLVRQTSRLPSEVEDGLWELLAGGYVTADGFDNLRALIDPKRRRGEGRGSKKRPRHAAGRWALLSHAGTNDQSRRTRSALRSPVADAVGRAFARSAGSRSPRATMAGSVARSAPHGGARRDSRRTICLRALRGEQFARPEALDLLRTVRRDSDHSVSRRTVQTLIR